MIRAALAALAALGRGHQHHGVEAMLRNISKGGDGNAAAYIEL